MENEIVEKPDYVEELVNLIRRKVSGRDRAGKGSRYYREHGCG